MPADHNLAADSIGALDTISVTAITAAAENIHVVDTAEESAEILTAAHGEVRMDLEKDVHLTVLHGLDPER